MLRYTLWLPGWLAICIVFLVAVSIPTGQVPIFMGVPSSEVVGEIDLMTVGKWSALCSIPLLANGIILERSRQIELFSVLRVKTRKHFRLHQVKACVICTFIWAAVIFGVTACQLKKRMAVEIFILLLPNLLLWNGIGLVFYALSKKASWSLSMPLALVAGSCLIGAHIPSWLPYVPSTWGMLSQTVQYGARGNCLLMPLASSLSATISYLLFIFYEENEDGNH